MKELCLVTTYKREELLWLCLEAIRREDPNLPIYVFSDRGEGSPELAHTWKTFGANCIIRDPHNYYGNSWNLLDACQWAVGQGGLIVHLIEDDTILHKGYFDWARNQLAFHDFAAVCGRIGSPHITNWYESPCASWNTIHLRIALSHVIPEYFTEKRVDMQKVLDEQIFPKSKYKKGGAEQDGFFLRCIEHHQWKTKFPPKPLASHLGFWGYNSPPLRKGPEGSFEARIAAIRDLQGNRQLRKSLFGHRIADAEMGELSE